MPAQVLYPLYLVVMGAAAVCFTMAFRVRKTTPRHMRWALTGLALDLTGTAVVLLFHRVLGWPMPETHRGVVLVHRAVAVVVTCLLLTVAFAGWRRWRIHPRLGTVLLPLYWVTLALACVGYWPYG
jgi:hypothetical protein